MCYGTTGCPTCSRAVGNVDKDTTPLGNTEWTVLSECCTSLIPKTGGRGFIGLPGVQQTAYVYHTQILELKTLESTRKCSFLTFEQTRIS